MFNIANHLWPMLGITKWEIRTDFKTNKILIRNKLMVNNKMDNNREFKIVGLVMAELLVIKLTIIINNREYFCHQLVVWQIMRKVHTLNNNMVCLTIINSIKIVFIINKKIAISQISHEKLSIINKMKIEISQMSQETPFTNKQIKIKFLNIIV